MDHRRDRPWTRVAKVAAGYHLGSPQMIANDLFEERFIEWATERVTSQGSMVKAEVINGGANWVGCSPSTSTKYLAKITSCTGHLAEVSDKVHGTLIVLREKEVEHGDSGLDTSTLPRAMEGA